MGSSTIEERWTSRSVFLILMHEKRLLLAKEPYYVPQPEILLNKKPDDSQIE